jgi:hypothetical protein
MMPEKAHLGQSLGRVRWARGLYAAVPQAYAVFRMLRDMPSDPHNRGPRARLAA